MSELSDLRKEVRELRDLIEFALLPDAAVATRNGYHDAKGRTIKRDVMVELVKQHNSKKLGRMIAEGEVGQVSWVGESQYTGGINVGVRLKDAIAPVYVPIEKVRVYTGKEVK